MTFEPTSEQLHILSLAKNKESLLINALAGAAKTTTLCLLAKKLPVVPTLCCAFNKRIAMEMEKRMPSHISCRTMNALGHAAWAKSLSGKRLVLETDKMYTIVKELIDRRAPEEKKALGEAFGSILRLTRMAKSAGYVPPKFRSMSGGLIEFDDFLNGSVAQLDVDPDGRFIDIFTNALELSIAQSYEGKIDFDDQIYMSTLFAPEAYTRYPIVMVDEAQDLSPLNHETLALMVEATGRLIAVGDPYQAIYAFRGASTTSMSLLQERFDMTTTSLSISFRCPKKVVERARFRVPYMQYPEWAIEGKVESLGDGWTSESITDGSAVICRNNAPLLTLALRLIRAGRGIKLVGFDIGANLVKVLSKLGDGNLPRDTVLGLINEWENAQIKKAHEARKASIRDRAECLRVFANEGSTLAAAVAYAERIFSSAGPIQLMTGHKSKGGEWDTVFHLNPFLIPSKFARRLAEETGDESQLEQERNLRYVTETRSMRNLYFINLEEMA